MFVLNSSGVGTGAGPISIMSGGTLLADNSGGTATGTGNINIATGGTLQIGNADAAHGSVTSTSTIIDNGKVALARSDTTTLNSPISGTGGIT